jgi:serine/threonine-protein kinase
MAEVFLARQDGPEGFAKIVVVKRILPHMAQDAEFIQMFLDEARLVARINHANVVSVSELGKDDATGAYFIVMEYIDGCNLKRVAHAAARAGTPLSPAMCARIIADACAGLDYAHNLKDDNQQPLNIIHRDITPENLLITYADGMVKVVDFGIAKVASTPGHTKPGKVKGKFSYVAPEQFRGQPMDRRVDVWSLGVTLYWLLSGTRPFHGETEAALIHHVLEVEPLPLHEADEAIPRRLSEIVLRALKKPLDARYPSAAALRDDLESWLASTPEPSSRTELAKLISGYFPEATDEERVRRRAFISGDPAGQISTQTDFQLGTSPGRGILSEPTSSSADVSFGQMLAPRRSVGSRVAIGAAAVLTLAGVLWVGGRRPPDRAPEPRAEAATPPSPKPPAPTAETAKPDEAKPEVAKADPTRTETAPPEPVKQDPPTPDDATSPEAAVSPHPHPPPKAVAKRAPASGHIAVMVAPWAKVFVDGKEMGVTPFAPLEVKAGRHHLLLVNDEIRASREISVEVKSGRTATVRVNLE